MGYRPRMVSRNLGSHECRGACCTCGEYHSGPGAFPIYHAYQPPLRPLAEVERRAERRHDNVQVRMYVRDDVKVQRDESRIPQGARTATVVTVTFVMVFHLIYDICVTEYDGWATTMLLGSILGCLLALRHAGSGGWTENAKALTQDTKTTVIAGDLNATSYGRSLLETSSRDSLVRAINEVANPGALRKAIAKGRTACTHPNEVRVESIVDKALLAWWCPDCQTTTYPEEKPDVR